MASISTFESDAPGGDDTPRERRTLWIRFNPNAFTVNGVTRRVPKRRKLERLVQAIHECSILGLDDGDDPGEEVMESGPISLLPPNGWRGTRVLYMFYDSTRDPRGPTIRGEGSPASGLVPLITLEPAYDDRFRDLTLPALVD